RGIPEFGRRCTDHQRLRHRSSPVRYPHHQELVGVAGAKDESTRPRDRKIARLSFFALSAWCPARCVPRPLRASQFSFSNNFSSPTPETKRQFVLSCTGVGS